MDADICEEDKNVKLLNKSSFGKLTSPTNLHQISTGDPASLFHSKISLLLDSHFPSGAPPIPLVLNDCSPPSCLSPSEVDVVFRKLRGGKAPVAQQPMRAKDHLRRLPNSLYLSLDPEVHEQMLRSGGQSDANPPVLSSQASVVLKTSIT
ncbi:hypothetical protein TNCV_5042261 [Trichonephila clavipes]|nr:hypothetical protein TNCV_5042261 [Trichonephila clavipes]